MTPQQMELLLNGEPGQEHTFVVQVGGDGDWGAEVQFESLALAQDEVRRQVDVMGNKARLLRVDVVTTEVQS